MKNGRWKRVLRRILIGSGVTLAAVGLTYGGWQAMRWASIDSQTRAHCAAMMKMPVTNGRVVSAKVSARGFEPSLLTIPFGVWGFNLPESCRVRIILTPVPDSRIETEIWLPTKHWNERLQGVGNGGLAGSVELLSMRSALQYGYAVAGTDTGHQADGGDGRWALKHPEKLKDYGWRAIHETAVAAKAVIKQFYGKPQRYAYFAGGSNGGRQALMEAQRFPDDYDGIVAGAPSVDDHVPTISWIQQQLTKSDASYISDDKLPAISKAVLKACDGLDGVKDGVVEDPRSCKFDPKILLCKAASDDSCLTTQQIASLQAVYDGPGISFDGRPARGFAHGGESGWGDWITGRKKDGSIGYLLTAQFYRYLIYGDPKWDMSRYSLQSDWEQTARRLGPDFGARDPDLSKFMQSGGKLILYHGWSDPALQPLMTIDYFERVLAIMGSQTSSFVRLYMAPGVEHVAGGPGPNVFGQFPTGKAVDRRHSVTAAVQAWVEQGIAPDAIIASKYDSDFKPLLLPYNATPKRTRPLCPYPAVARWKGSGSTDDTRNFTCVTPAG